MCTHFCGLIFRFGLSGGTKISHYRIAGNFRSRVKFSLSGLESVFSWSYIRCMP